MKITVYMHLKLQPQISMTIGTKYLPLDLRIMGMRELPWESTISLGCNVISIFGLNESCEEVFQLLNIYSQNRQVFEHRFSIERITNYLIDVY